MANQGTHEVAEYSLYMAFAHVQYVQYIYVYAHIMSVRLTRLRRKLYIASPAYTSVAMTTPMGRRPQCEDGAPPKYVHVNVNR